MKSVAGLLGMLCLLGAGSAVDAQDLGVTHISRSPLYDRFKLDYRPIPGWERDWPFRVSTQGNADPRKDKQWPAAGEAVTFTGHVRNHGTLASGAFHYRWKINGQTIHEGMWNGLLNPGEEANVTASWTWPLNLGDRTVTLEIDPNRNLPDTSRWNNVRTDYTNALSFSIWIEEPLYQRFKTVLNGVGTRSFEDWIQWQFNAFKASLTGSRHPFFAPFGVTERVRIEKIVVIPFDANDLNAWQKVMDQDPDLYRNDGRWQFVAEGATLEEKQAKWDEYLATFARKIDTGLIHELMHQIGVIDMYQMNNERVDNLVPTRTGQPVGRVHHFPDFTLMAGGYGDNVRNDPLFLDETSAYALQLHRRKRRGYYGEYLWDTPQTTILRFRDVNGAPLKNATLAFFQKKTGQIPSVATFVGRTDQAGEFVMPNRPVPKVERTATGHVLRPNPFGPISVVGDNGVMMIRIREGAQEEFRWLEVIQLNEEYWRGNRSVATLEIQTQMTPGVRDLHLNNLALKATVTASSDQSDAWRVIDGKTDDKWAAWHPDEGREGEYIQFDLKAARWINTMVVWPVGDGHDWYERFKIEVSTTGQFAGEQTLAYVEPNWDETRLNGAFRIQRPSGLQERVDYRFAPAFGRYLRLTGLHQQNYVGLREVEIYPCLLPVAVP